jgi:uncharacterized RDD family membrane protein YckC
MSLMKYATIFRRVAAYLLDSLFVFIFLVTALQFMILVPIRHLFIGSEKWFQTGWNTEAYTLLTISLPIWLYFILTEVSPWQATIAKHLFKLRTVDPTTKNQITLKQAVVRTGIKLLPWEIAHFTNNIPTPMWYDPNPTLRIGFIPVPMLVILYIVLASVTPKKQSLHDLAAKTVVIYNG